MSLYLTPEQRDAGQKAFQESLGRHHAMTRRDFIKGVLAAGGAVAAVTPAVYFGYQAFDGNPVRVGLIGAGDEGGVLVGFHNPKYLEVVAVSDIRPTNQRRIYDGEPTGWRKGLNHFYGNNARDKIKLHADYKALLADPNVEAVVIALPLHLHAPVTVEALRAGKHVLCEKLMAWNVSQCKDMIRAADEADRVLTIGHQRHYSLMYSHADELLRAGTLGTVKHIRALWHRNNTFPLLDKDGKPVLDEKGQPMLRDGWRQPVAEEDRKALADRIRQLGYKSMEELVRWRIYQRTGGGLMAELGSHQLDACSIFLGKVHPLAVTGVGGKFFYKDDREVDDHVFTTFEFPGANYYKKGDDGEPVRGRDGRPEVADRNDVVVVTYSSISTNDFEPYGECVMGNEGTLLVEREESIMLFPKANPNKKAPDKPTGVAVTTAGGGKPAADSSSTWGGPSPAQAQALGQALMSGPPSRGYAEEMEHFAYCVRMHQKAKDKSEQVKWRLAPRCHGRVAMADAIIALTSNLAMKKHQRIEFKEEWFDATSNAVPDAEMVPEIVTG
jgi:predicted dehydrogenase